MDTDRKTFAWAVLRWASVLLVIGLLVGCDDDDWTGHVYPDKDHLLDDQYVGTYPSLSECRGAALAVISLLPDPTRADWECGLNCEPWAGGVLACEKTLR